MLVPEFTHDLLLLHRCLKRGLVYEWNLLHSVYVIVNYMIKKESLSVEQSFELTQRSNPENYSETTVAHLAQDRILPNRHFVSL